MTKWSITDWIVCSENLWRNRAREKIQKAASVFRQLCLGQNLGCLRLIPMRVQVKRNVRFTDLRKGARTARLRVPKPVQQLADEPSALLSPPLAATEGFPRLSPNSDTETGSTRVPRVSSGVAPELSSHHLPAIPAQKIGRTRFSARRRKPHAGRVCSPKLIRAFHSNFGFRVKHGHEERGQRATVVA